MTEAKPLRKRETEVYAALTEDWLRADEILPKIVTNKPIYKQNLYFIIDCLKKKGLAESKSTEGKRDTKYRRIPQKKPRGRPKGS